MIFHKNACKNTISKIAGAITCGADQFQCKFGICLYTDNSNCNGPCIRSDWTNDGTEDCTDWPHMQVTSNVLQKHKYHTFQICYII